MLILSLDAALKDSKMVPDVLPDLNSMVPVPLDGGEVNSRVILVSTPTLVAPSVGVIEVSVKAMDVKL
jgi:hypothetical protein